MTTPAERTRALRGTRDFLQELCDPERAPGVPDAVRQHARWCLRHYPQESTLRMLSTDAPQLLAPPPPGGDTE